MTWLSVFGDLRHDTRAELEVLQSRVVPRGVDLFSHGDRAHSFPVVLSGRIDVSLTGPSGREILLYSVESGQSCIQTTLGLLGDEPYSGVATTVAEDRGDPHPQADVPAGDGQRSRLSRLCAAVPSGSAWAI